MGRDYAAAKDAEFGKKERCRIPGTRQKKLVWVFGDKVKGERLKGKGKRLKAQTQGVR